MMLVLIVPTIPGRLLRRGGLRIRSDGALARLRIGDGLVFGRFRLLLARRLVRALLIVVFWLRDVVVGAALGFRAFVLRMRRAPAPRPGFRFGDTLLAFGVVQADILGVAAHER